jgi:hypothetical protein
MRTINVFRVHVGSWTGVQAMFSIPYFVDLLVSLFFAFIDQIPA